MALQYNFFTIPSISLIKPQQTNEKFPKSHLKNQIFSTNFQVGTLKFINFSSKTTKLRSNLNNNGNTSKVESSGFRDDKGEDLEGYLNSLSLEYDSVWDTKPSWCQPWTIALTGVSVVAISWLILHSVIITVLASCVIGAWWYIFLYSYPKSYSEMIAERRKRVSGGYEDTYGSAKNQ